MSPPPWRTILKSLDATGLLLASGRATAAARSGDVAVGDARFRVDHFSLNVPPVNMYVDGDSSPDLQGVPSGALPDYFTVLAGVYQIEVTPAGDALTVVIDAGVTFRCNRDYTVVVTDVLDAVAPIVLTGTNRPAPYGKASVRVIHFPPGVLEVDIVVEDGPTLSSGLAFGDVSQHEMVPAGTYDLQVALSLNGAVAFDLPGTTPPGGQIISVFAIGLAVGGPSGFSVLSVADTVSPTRKPKPPFDGDVCRMG